MDLIKEFITNIYYKNDILALTGVNCFNYETGEVDAAEVVKAINAAGLKVTIKPEY